MEITNEIKAKVFAQYLGQKIKMYGGQIVELSVLFTGRDYVTIKDVLDRQIGLKRNELVDLLILKPLSAITDEDKEVVEKLEDINDPYTEGYITWGKTWYELTYKNNNYGYVRPLLLESSQFLQSKGYDLPLLILGQKTLQKCGLAIYY